MKSSVRWRSGNNRYLLLGLLVLASAIGGVALSWTAFGRQLDNYAYDFLFRLEQPQPWQLSSIILAIDERTLNKYHGIAGMRGALAQGLDHIRPFHPAAVAVDLILPEPGDDAQDARLEQAFAQTHN